MNHATVDPDQLNTVMEFDHVIQVHEDGTVTDELPNVRALWAPSLLDEELDSTEWRLFTKGYSGQDRYNGPVMHNSEFIGGRLAKDILATPGYYVAIVADWTPAEDEPEDTDTAEGWAIAYRETT